MKLIAFFILVVDPMMPVNPLYGANHDWAPLKAEYAACSETSTTYFQYVVCTTGAHNRALHPTINA